MKKSILVMFGVTLWSFSLAAAQQATAEIGGKVVDTTGAVIPGATVSVVNQETGTFRRELLTGEDGVYLVTALRPGLYQVTVEMPGFKKAVRSDIVLRVGIRQDLDITLDVGELSETVVVTGEARVVETTSKEVGGEVATHEIVELPSVNRNFIGFVGLLPGVLPNISSESFGADSVSVNGQDSRNANFLIDGVSNNDDVIGQRAGGQTRIALETVAEFQVITSQFDAQFGKSSGGIINAITKSGTNGFHGSLLGFFMDETFDANRFFNNQNGLEKPPSSEQQWAATLGGPIVKDRVHFFASIEHVSIEEGVTINIPQRPEFNRALSESTKALNTMIKGDFQLSDKHQLSSRWVRESSPQFNQIIPRFGLPVTERASRAESDIDQTIVTTLTSTFGPRFVNEIRLGLTRENVAFAQAGFNGGTPQEQLPPTLRFNDFVDQQNDIASARINNSWALEEVASFFLSGWGGDHNITTGIQYNYVSADNFNATSLNGIFRFPNNLPFDPSDPNTFPNRLTIRVGGAETPVIINHNLGLFVQDKWQLDPRLTLSLGLRWDKEYITDDNNNFAPRVGLSFDPKGDGKNVIRGGFGLFYDKTTISLFDDFVRDAFFVTSFTRNFPLNGRDEGPENGMFPTDPVLAGGPFVDRNLINSIVGTGAQLRNTSPTIDNPDRGVPFVRTFNVGWEREIVRGVSLKADYIHSDGVDQFVRVDLNAGFRTTPTGSITRPDPTLSTLRTYKNVGKSDFDALELSLNRRFSSSYSYRLSYTLGHTRGTTTGNEFSDALFQQGQELNLDLNQGRSNFDRRHNFVASGTWEVPHTTGLTLSTVFRAVSGQPFTIQNTRLDTDLNGINFDPLPAGTYSGIGSNPITVESNGKRNGASGPAFYNADVRTQYKRHITEEVSAAFSFEVFNVFNRANFNTPSGNFASSSGTPSTNFLNLRSTSFPRMLQFGFRVAF
ncbi:MAG: TonB-dependent receptor domain-containing protein [Acidobacteriota bacterium]